MFQVENGNPANRSLPCFLIHIGETGVSFKEWLSSEGISVYISL